MKNEFLVISSSDSSYYKKGDIGIFVRDCDVFPEFIHLRFGESNRCILKDEVIPNPNNLEDFIEQYGKLTTEIIHQILKRHPEWKQEVIG